MVRHACHFTLLVDVVIFLPPKRLQQVQKLLQQVQSTRLTTESNETGFVQKWIQLAFEDCHLRASHLSHPPSLPSWHPSAARRSFASVDVPHVAALLEAQDLFHLLCARRLWAGHRLRMGREDRGVGHLSKSRATGSGFGRSSEVEGWWRGGGGVVERYFVMETSVVCSKNLNGTLPDDNDDD